MDRFLKWKGCEGLKVEVERKEKEMGFSAKDVGSGGMKSGRKKDFAMNEKKREVVEILDDEVVEVDKDGWPVFPTKVGKGSPSKRRKAEGV